MSSSVAKAVFVVGAKRTPFGAFGGCLKTLTATDLGVHATKAALVSSGVPPSAVDAVFFGNVVQSSPDAAYLARHVGLRSGCPVSSPALTINRLCGSGFETVVQGIHAIATAGVNVTVCGGTENMSSAPFSVDGNNMRWGVALGKGPTMYDSLWSGLTDSHAGTPMAITAENLAKKYGITRLDCDEYAILSQERWAKANSLGHFDLEIEPVSVNTKKGSKSVAVDEHPRPESTVEKISQLRPVFLKDGVVTAANASGICDGAGSIVLASEEAVNKLDLKPLARIVSYGIVGCEPTIMGIGPVGAIIKATDVADISINSIDRFEINEAFAAQYLACEKELDIDREKTNVNGGAISIGHPLGASGSRIIAHLSNEFSRRPETELKYCVGSACIGGGQGIAVLLERS